MVKSILLLLTLSLFVPAYASTGKVSEYKLSNGLKLIVKEDHRAPVVIAEVWYKVGSGYEPKGITGISHVLEHMMFRGTKKYSPGELKKIVADNGGDINAFTDYDFTGYYEKLSADKLSVAFKLEADRMHGLLLDRDTFRHELQVVLEEWRMRLKDNPQAMTYERFMAAAHVASPYHHMVIGWLSDIKYLTVQDLCNWYHSWYAPNNAIVVVVGDVNPKDVYKLARKYFGHVAAHDVPKLKPQTEIPPLGKRTVVVNLPAKLPWLIIGYNVPTLKTADEIRKAYALDVIEAILDGGDSARIPKNIIRGQQIAVDAGAYYPLYSRLDNLFLLEGTPASGHTIKELKKALLQQIKQLRTTLVTKKELNRVKAQVIANKVYAKDSISAQAHEIGSLEAVGLSWHYADLYVQNVEEITPEQIRAVAREYLISKRLTVGVLRPIKTGEKDAKS